MNNLAATEGMPEFYFCFCFKWTVLNYIILAEYSWPNIQMFHWGNKNNYPDWIHWPYRPECTCFVFFFSFVGKGSTMIWHKQHQATFGTESIRNSWALCYHYWPPNDCLVQNLSYFTNDRQQAYHGQKRHYTRMVHQITPNHPKPLLIYINIHIAQFFVTHESSGSTLIVKIFWLKGLLDFKIQNWHMRVTLAIRQKLAPM